MNGLILAAAAACTEPLDLRHDCGPVPGVWAFARGVAVPGRPGTVLGVATCTACGARRGAVVPPDGHPLAGPVTDR